MWRESILDLFFYSLYLNTRPNPLPFHPFPQVPAKCEPPQLLRTVIREEDQCGIEITWKRPHDCGSMLTQYHIVCDDGSMECKVPASQHSYMFLPFQPGTEHQFRIRAENFVGWGEVSETSSKIKAPSLPTTPPRNVEVRHSKHCPTKVIVSWRKPQKERGSRVKSYECAMRILDGSSDANTFKTVRDDIEAETRQIEVGGLRTETTIEFKMRCKNDAGFSNWSEISNKCVTECARKPEKIEEVRIENLNPNGCCVYWNESKQEHGSKVRKYHVYWHRAPVISGEKKRNFMTKREREAMEDANKKFPPNAWLKCVTVEGRETRKITLKNLNSSNMYHFKVTCENDAGESEMSKSSDAVKPPTRMQFILMKREEKRRRRGGGEEVEREEGK